MANPSTQPGPVNGGFLASWGEDGGSGGEGSGGPWGEPPSGPRDRPAATPFGDTGGFQTAGGAGGGFVNYASWLLGSQENAGNKFLQGFEEDRGHPERGSGTGGETQLNNPNQGRERLPVRRGDTL